MKTAVYFDCPQCEIADALICEISFDQADTIILRPLKKCADCGTTFGQLVYMTRAAWEDEEKASKASKGAKK